jgi:hypothetical protein
MKHYERINVECYSGYKANERPMAFIYQDRRREIEEVIDRWHEGGKDPRRPAVDYFKVRTCGGKVFILRYLALFDSWSILTDDQMLHKDPIETPRRQGN